MFGERCIRHPEDSSGASVRGETTAPAVQKKVRRCKGRHGERHSKHGEAERERGGLGESIPPRERWSSRSTSMVGLSCERGSV